MASTSNKKKLKLNKKGELTVLPNLLLRLLYVAL